MRAATSCLLLLVLAGFGGCSGQHEPIEVTTITGAVRPLPSQSSGFS
jgi:hypothetical protein